MNTECLLAVLPGTSDDKRLAVFLQQTTAGDSQISLRQQTWAQGIGWYDQKTLELDPSQLRMLRGVLGGASSRRAEPTEAPAVLPFSRAG